jgi:hypothetical protein
MWPFLVLARQNGWRGLRVDDRFGTALVRLVWYPKFSSGIRDLESPNLLGKFGFADA